MKKAILSAIFIISSLVSFSQTKDSVFVYKYVDEMSDEVYYMPSRKIVCVNEDNTKGFSVSVFIDCAKDSSLSFGDLNVKIVGLGGCVENSEIIILFDDGTKIKATSWNEFNCKGNAWITLKKEDELALSSKKISKIKVTNGRTFDSYTGVLSPDDSDYFIQLFIAMKNRNIKQYKGE